MRKDSCLPPGLKSFICTAESISPQKNLPSSVRQSHKWMQEVNTGGWGGVGGVYVLIFLHTFSTRSLLSYVWIMKSSYLLACELCLSASPALPPGGNDFQSPLVRSWLRSVTFLSNWVLAKKCFPFKKHRRQAGPTTSTMLCYTSNLTGLPYHFCHGHHKCCSQCT